MAAPLPPARPFPVGDDLAFKRAYLSGLYAEQGGGDPEALMKQWEMLSTRYGEVSKRQDEWRATVAAETTKNYQARTEAASAMAKALADMAAASAEGAKAKGGAASALLKDELTQASLSLSRVPDAVALGDYMSIVLLAADTVQPGLAGNAVANAGGFVQADGKVNKTAVDAMLEASNIDNALKDAKASARLQYLSRDPGNVAVDTLTESVDRLGKTVASKVTPEALMQADPNLSQADAVAVAQAAQSYVRQKAADVTDVFLDDSAAMNTYTENRDRGIQDEANRDRLIASLGADTSATPAMKKAFAAYQASAAAFSGASFARDMIDAPMPAKFAAELLDIQQKLDAVEDQKPWSPMQDAVDDLARVPGFETAMAAYGFRDNGAGAVYFANNPDEAAAFFKAMKDKETAGAPAGPDEMKAWMAEQKKAQRAGETESDFNLAGTRARQNLNAFGNVLWGPGYTDPGKAPVDRRGEPSTLTKLHQADLENDLRSAERGTGTAEDPSRPGLYDAVLGTEGGPPLTVLQPSPAAPAAAAPVSPAVASPASPARAAPTSAPRVAPQASTSGVPVTPPAFKEGGSPVMPEAAPSRPVAGPVANPVAAPTMGYRGPERSLLENYAYRQR